MLGRWPHSIAVLIFVYSLMDAIYGVRFTVEPSDRVAVLDQSLLWDCQAVDDTSVVTYRWTFNTDALPLHQNQVIYSNGSLLIRKVTYDDVGTYKCLATAGEITVSSRSLRFDIAYINPTFMIQPVSQTVILGDNVILSCYIESLPPADVRWTLDGEAVTNGDQKQESNGTSTLSLYPVMYYHVGTYKCVGTNPLTGVYRYSNDANLVVRGQPVFLSSLKSVSVPLGFQATFDCYFHGNPEPTVTWFVHHTSNGDVISQEIQDSEKYTVYENGTFIIYNVTEKDEAFYTCTVGNSFGEMSESAMLTVTGPATTPEFSLKPSNNTVKEGDSVNFLCSCTGNPEPSATWRKGSSIISENGSLSINEAQSTDVGWYSCFCENAVGSVSQSVYLDVYTFPVITSSPVDVVVEKGDPVYIQCSASGNPSPSISWLTPRFGNVISSINGVILYQNGTLYLTSVSQEDTGEYTCLARNIVGMVEASSTVTVQVPAEMTLRPLSQGVNVGSKVFLHCQASGVPEPVYSWSKDGEGMITSTSQRQIYLNNTLVIHSVTKQDEGVYRCVAGNDLGVTRAIATLTVTVPPRFTTVPTNSTVLLGGTVQIQCVADGDPLPTQRWTKDDRQLVSDDNLSVSLNQTILTITDIKASQFGKYTCIASNIAGTESVSAWLKVYDIPVFTVTPIDTIVNQSATLTLTCQGQAIEAPSVKWYKGREGEMTQLTNDNRVTITDGGLLQIKPVDSGTDEGWYTCVIQNTAGSISREVFVDVQVSPRILSTNSPQSATIQSQVTLTCQSSGDPAPTLEWINPSGHVITPSSAYQMIDNVLKISSVSTEDVGDWNCKYCNTLGCDSASVMLYLEGMPIIRSFSGTKDGSLVSLECIVEGNPEPVLFFTSKGQSLTSTEGTPLQGHTVKNNRLLIEVEYLNTEYTCMAGNVHGTTYKTISVPSKLDPLLVSKTESGRVTLTWNLPDSVGNLPLTGYSLQQKSDLDVTWQPVDVQGHDILNEKSLDVTETVTNGEYVFRMAARNLLGLGEYSDQSSSVVVKSAAPSPPKNVFALEIETGVILIAWEKSQNLNAPLADVVYEYKIVRPGNDRDSEIIHRQGTILYNQTLQVRVDDLTKAVVYSFSVWVRNVKLNVSSKHVTIELDNTAAEYLVPEPHSGIDSFGRDKLIAIVAGSLGGIILIIIIVCLVSRIRTQRKSKSLSLLDHTLSLDQFYMENPKTLYNDDSYRSKRKSCHSFYSFDESFHSTMGSKGKHDGSVEYLGSSMSNDVLLISKSPLGTETQRPLSQNSSRDQLYNENFEETTCVQSEIELPNSDITHVKQVVKDDESQGHSLTKPYKETKATDGAREEECQDDVDNKYSLMKSDNPEAVSPDQTSEHMNTSVHRGDLLPSQKHSVHKTKQPSKGADNYGSQKRPLKVFRCENMEAFSNPVTMETCKDTNEREMCNSIERNHKGRCTRSASPGVSLKGSDSNNKPKPPIRVLSLDLLNPLVTVSDKSKKDLKLLSESMLSEKRTPENKSKDKERDFSHKNNRHIVNYLENGFHDNNKMKGDINGEMFNDSDEKDIRDHKANVFIKDAKTRAQNEQRNENKDGPKGGNSVSDASRRQVPVNPKETNSILKRKPKNVIDDNFLSDAEIKQEVLSAELY